MSEFFKKTLLILFLTLTCFSCVRRRNYDFYKYQNRNTFSDNQLNYQQAYREIQSNALETNQIENQISERDIRKKFLWELWGEGRDLEGNIITNTVIESADKLSMEGKLRESLEEYQRARIENLSRQEKDALIARIASTELALNEAQNTLSIISEYARTQGIKIEEINQYVALMLAYAYGSSGEFDQSLAWFSRVNRLDLNKTMLSMASKSGASLLLSSISDSALENLAKKWSTDLFVYDLIGQERQKRFSGKKVISSDTNSFWEKQEEIKNNINVEVVKDKKIIAVLLPLSGKYQKLGENTKKGIALAKSSILESNGIEVSFFDTKGDPFYADELVREILQNQNVVMFLGPLLSDVSERVSYLIQQSGIPMLTFSKNDAFTTGHGVFRLGITPDTEINSLLRALYEYKGVRRYAVIYPENDKGHLYFSEFKKVLEKWQEVEIVYEGSYYPEDSNSLLLIASELENKGVQAVFMPDSLKTVAKFKYSLSPTLKNQILVVGTSIWDNQEQLIASNAALNGCIFTSPFFDKDKKELIQKFNKVYQDKYKERPDFLSAQGFDAITMVFASIKRAIEESLTIEDAFVKIQSYVGLTGVIGVEEEGEIHRILNVVQWKNRSRESIMIPSSVN